MSKLLSLALCVFGIGGLARGAGQYLKIDYPASTATNELQVAVTYELWIPEGVKEGSAMSSLLRVAKT